MAKPRGKKQATKGGDGRTELRSVFLTDEQVEAADRLSAELEWSRAKFCRKAIEAALALGGIPEAKRSAA